MHRVDGPGNDNNKFTSGDPATGTPATIVVPDWLNAVQEEIANVIEAAGIALDKTQDDQLLAAIQTLNGGPGAMLPDPYLQDEQEPVETDLQRDALVFPAGSDGWTWNSVQLWRSEVAWQLEFELIHGNAETADIDWRVAYLVVPDGTANPVVKERWQASHAYSVGDQVIPLGTHLNGYYYECSTAGTSGASQPTWGTTEGGYTDDGTAVWTCKIGGMKGLSDLVTPPGEAWRDWKTTPSGLVIPSGEASAGDRLHVGLWRRGSADANGGNLRLVAARIYPVEV